jgi:hypothetical protein
MYRDDRESILLALFGVSPKTRLLDLFMDNPLFEFTRNEMMETLGMAKVTLYGTLPDLEASGVIKETRKIGKASLYRLNGGSAVVKNLELLIRSYAMALGDVESEPLSYDRKIVEVHDNDDLSF